MQGKNQEKQLVLISWAAGHMPASIQMFLTGMRTISQTSISTVTGKTFIEAATPCREWEPGPADGIL